MACQGQWSTRRPLDIHETWNICRFIPFRPAYRGYTGGVLSIWRSQYEAANGFSNEFWGWGGEDDEFYNRLKNKGFDVIRDLTRNAGFFSLEHDLTSANPDRQNIIKEHKRNPFREGLNSTDYFVKKRQRNPLFTFLSVDLLYADCADNWIAPNKFI